VFLVLTVAGCEPDNKRPVISLDEARRLTADFSGPSAAQTQRNTATERSAEAVAASISEPTQADGSARSQLQAFADRQPTGEGTSTVELLNFYNMRASAAAQLGRQVQRLEDQRKAWGYAQQLPTMPPLQKVRVAFDLGWAENSAGNYREAIQAFETALTIAPSPNWQINVYSALVQVAAQSFDIAKAEAYRDQAKPIASQIVRDPWTQFVHPALMDFVVAHRSGKYAEAEQAGRRAVAALARIDVTPAARPFFVERHIDLVWPLLSQDRVTEAEAEARKALRFSRELLGRDHLTTVYATRALAEVFAAQGRTREALAALNAALETLQRMRVPAESMSFMYVRRAIVSTTALGGNWPQTVAQLDIARNEMANRVDIYDKYYGGVAWRYIALSETGRSREILGSLRASHDMKKKNLGENHYFTAEFSALLAMALSRLQGQEEALSLYRGAMPILLSRSRMANSDNSSVSLDARLQIILESYIDFLAEVKGTPLEQANGIDAAAEAFQIADSARGRSVQRALTASAARSAVNNPDLADLARREQDTERQIATLFGIYNDALGLPAEQQDRREIERLRARIDALRDARASIIAEIERRFPDYADLISPQPATLEQARKSLRPGETLVTMYVGARKTFVWAVPHSGQTMFAAAPIGKDAVTATVARLRRALDPNAASLGDIPDFDVASAHELYRALLQPVEAAWQRSNNLLVVPHGALAQIPLAVLPTSSAPLPAETSILFANYKSVPWLARKIAVTQLPSVASLSTLRALPPGNPNRQPFIGFGDPWFSKAQAAEASQPEKTEVASADVTTRGIKLRRRNKPPTDASYTAEYAQLPRLSETADEIRSVAIALKANPELDVLTGRRANEKAVKTMDLANRRIVMFATHGLVPGDLTGLNQPALALSAPDVADIDGDGLLSMEEILSLKLDADWVVLSACNTAAGSGSGAEAVSGLGRAFFYAGARALLVTNWPVETTSALALTTDLFRRQAAGSTLSRAEALQQAMLALIDGRGGTDAAGRTLYSYAHPIFWAPFAIIGDGGRG
jgi:CHAT domain-containing protein/tetratricopeptide (TPR) repeat protein